MPRETYIITIHRPEGLTVKETKAYLKEAVELWSRGTDRYGLLWQIGDKPITVKRERKQR